jgi:hypothetical protein
MDSGGQNGGYRKQNIENKMAEMRQEKYYRLERGGRA